MSLQIFIQELEQRELLSQRQLAKLREAAVERQMSPKALAKFLVQKNHLSQKQATDILQAVLIAGGELDNASPPNAVSSFQADPPELELAPLGEEAPAAPEEDAGSSSIFAPYLQRTPSKPPKSPPPADELILLPDIDSTEPTIESTRSGKNADRGADLSEASMPYGLSDDAAEVALTADDVVGDRSEEVTSAGQPRVRNTTSLNRSKSKKKPSKSKPRPKSVKSKGKWDSPLMLIGGGGLMLMLLVGGLIWWLMNWQSGDQMLTQARSTRDSGAYAEAIKQYEDFLVSSTRHPEHGLAEVELAMLRIRQPTDAGDFVQALAQAETQLKSAESKDEFDETHGEIAALLPQIAQGLADQTAKAEAGSADATRFAELANRALELCSNEAYLPKPMRDEGKLSAVRETLSLVERRNATKKDLNDALAKMQEALTAKDTNTAFSTYAKVLITRPELADDKSLAEMLGKTTAAEQAAVAFVNDSKAAETTEPPVPWIASLAIANRAPTGAATAAGATAAAPNTVCIRVDGAVFALDAASGKLLWRRAVGNARSLWPVSISNNTLLMDSAQNELLLVDSPSGQLKWRQSLGEPFAQPLVVGDRAFVAADSGKLYVIDLASGGRLGFVQFGQPLRVAPAVDRTNERLYVVGDHSAVYSLLLKDLSSLGVYYLGHAPGSVTKAPAIVMDKLAVLENDGVETSRIRLLALSENGAIETQAVDRRLTGLASVAPIVAGRRLIVVTDRGQIDVFDIGGKGAEPLTLVATRAATGTTPLIRQVALADKNIWIGDNQLTKYSILPTGNRLPVEAIEDNFAGATFDHPPTLLGEVLIHARRPKGGAGMTVTATATPQGRTLWQTGLAVPLAGAPIVDAAAKTLTVADVEGNAYRFDEAAIRSRVQDTPLAAASKPTDSPALNTSLDLGNGQAAFCGAGSNQLLLVNPSLGAQAAKWVTLESPLACAASAANGSIVAPLSIGQVFLLNGTDGASLALPFQTTLVPGKHWNFTPAGAVEGGPIAFVITDGDANIYAVAVEGQPPQLKALATGKVDGSPIQAPIVVLGDTAMAIAGNTQLLRFKLPGLEAIGQQDLPAPVVWGPHRVADMIVVATANNELLAVLPDGTTKWRVPLEHGDLTGAPLAQGDGLLIAFRNGIIERRNLSDGKLVATKNLAQPLAAGPVPFLQWFVAAGSDGTLLVFDQP